MVTVDPRRLDAKKEINRNQEEAYMGEIMYQH